MLKQGRHRNLCGWLCLLGFVLAGQDLQAEDFSPSAPAAKAVFRVLQESVIRQRNGDTVTFKRVEPPVLPVEAAVPMKQPV